uniref:Tetraspanin 5 n=1 Tax=Sus scrofa TaxID=9823 RepID=A0A8D1P146_PIG
MSGKHYKGPEVSCCIKYFIFGFNVIFWFLGIAFLGIGLWAWNEKGVLSNISSITDLGGFDPVWLFLVVGGVMFILGFAGCIGALRENTFLLKFFSVFLGIIFFLELTAGVLAFVFKDWIKDQLYFFINNNIRAYRDDIDLQNLIDFTQEYVSLNLVYVQVESLLGKMTPMNTPPGFCICWKLPLTFLHGFFVLFCFVFCLLAYVFSSALLCDLQCVPSLEMSSFHLSQFLPRRTKKTTLRREGHHESHPFLSPFEDYCFAIGFPFYLKLNVCGFFSCSLPPFGHPPYFMAHNNVLLDRIFIHKVPEMMLIQILVYSTQS